MLDGPDAQSAFFFSDIEGSTRLELDVGTERYLEIRQLQRRIMRDALGAHGGREQGTEGDSFFVIFPDPVRAVRAAIAAQRAFAAAAWPGGSSVRIRMGLHAGRAVLSDDGTYSGIDINRAARIAAAGHGDQIVVSEAIRSALSGTDPSEFSLRDLGRQRLKDLPAPEWLFQVVADGLRHEFPALRSIDNRPNNLPAQMTSFIGRRHEIAEARRLLRTARLVTLTGPGGTGKTRLAQAIGAEALADFTDGVFWVGLGAIGDHVLVVPAISAALGIADDGTRPLVEVIAEAIDARELLLVLDNFEHVVDAAPLVTALLERAPRIRVLVTSRSALRVRGEQEFPVPPLAVPDPARTLSPDVALENESVALFVDRASAVRPSFHPSTADIDAIVSICARLDGLPLAIELAAARIRLFSPAALLVRLEDALGLLSGGGRDLPARQQTLRGAIGWSYDLLAPLERQLFGRLAVFAGGCDLEAAAAVCDADGELGVALLDALDSLVEKSLVRQTELLGEPRFRMLHVIREFGLEQLAASNEADAVRDRHLGYFADLARRAEPHLTSAASVPWLDRLEVEHDNIRAALRRARDANEAETGLVAAGHLWRFWHQRGHLGEGRALIVDLLRCPTGSKRSLGRAVALNGAASLAYWQNDFASARAEYEEARAIFGEMGDAAGEADVLHSLGYLELIDRHFDVAREAFEDARATFASLGDRRGISRALQGIILAAMLQADIEAVRQANAEALPLLRDLGERFGVANTLSVGGRAELIGGDLDAAEAMMRESIGLFLEAGDEIDTAMLLEDLGAVAVRRGQPDRAIRLAAAASAIRERMGGGPPRPLVLPLDYLDEARSRLEPAAAARAWAEGGALDAAAAVRFGLEDGTADERPFAGVQVTAAGTPEGSPR